MKNLVSDIAVLIGSLNTTHKKWRWILLGLVFSLGACIDPFSIPSPDNLRILAVDGIITTAPGPHLISLGYANQYTNLLEGRRVAFRGAMVSIVDDLGNEISLEEEILEERWFCAGGGFSEPGRPKWNLVTSNNFTTIFIRTGRYYTPHDFAAEIGRSYTLKIRTQEGVQYESDPELVRPVAPLEGIRLRHFNTATLNPLIDTKGVELIAEFSDPEDASDFYFWKTSNSIISLETETALNTPPRSLTPVPIDCCSRCYIPDMDSRKLFHALDDRSFNGLSTIQPIFRIVNDGIRFKSRYRVQINQYSISEKAFNFLKLIRQQLDIEGSVFDPPPANIRGNIKNVDQPEQQVLGYFMAVDVSSKMVYINADDIPNEFRVPRKVLPFDCKDYCGNLLEPPNLFPPDDWEYN